MLCRRFPAHLAGPCRGGCVSSLALIAFLFAWLNIRCHLWIRYARSVWGLVFGLGCHPQLTEIRCLNFVIVCAIYSQGRLESWGGRGQYWAGGIFQCKCGLYSKLHLCISGYSVWGTVWKCTCL